MRASPPDAGEAARKSYPESRKSGASCGIHLAIRFDIGGDLRFISHRDTLRLFERAAARARLPARFSGGFNPRPRIALPLPRAVGTASACELLLAELTEPVAPAEALARLAAQVPAGLRLCEAWALEPGTAVQPDQVSYELVLPAESVPVVAQAVERLLAAPQWEIRRGSPRDERVRSLDLRAFLVSATVEAGILAWTVRVTPAGSVRIAEMLSACGLESDVWRYQVRRTRVGWSSSAPF